MFTGLVEGTGRVTDITRRGGEIILTVMPLFDLSECKIGDSISVSGVCLTVTGRKGKSISMDVSGETISRSTLGSLNQGDEVNLERALRLSDRLGGHLVSGHVDGMGKILSLEPRDRSWIIKIGVDAGLAKYNIEKGSVAVDGISLTVNRCTDRDFEVNIIPETARQTTMLRKRVGDPVNVETDLIAKYIEKFLLKERSTEKRKLSSAIDQEMLNRFGFGG